MSALLRGTGTKGSKSSGPQLVSLTPSAVMPGGEVELRGSGLMGAGAESSSALPQVTVAGVPATLSLSRSERVVIRVAEGTTSGDVMVQRTGVKASNTLQLRVASLMGDELHPVANPVVGADGTIYTTVSGTRGQSVPVSLFSISPDLQKRPFVRGILNATGLAFGPDGFLYVSSRAEGTLYRVSPQGAVTTYATGMGIATGIAFDREGNLFVGDRSGTIFKVGPEKGRISGSLASGGQVSGEQTGGELGDREIFVYATLEPSVAAYHLAFNDEGTLFVSAPSTSSNQSIYAIDRDGRTSVYYQGLGRPQGMAFDVDGNLYVAASLRGQRGIVRITPQQEATLALSGNNLVGLAFLEDGCAALATRDALYHVSLNIEGRKLV
ncbi:MAG: gluconolaconase [Acidobacteriaceae bacterium]|nr:gluconolaconase [Acidobacteriaceae bacterium]